MTAAAATRASYLWHNCLKRASMPFPELCVMLAMNTVFHQEGRDNELGLMSKVIRLYRIPDKPENSVAWSAKGVLGRAGWFQVWVRILYSTSCSFSWKSDLNSGIVCAALTMSLRIGCPKTRSPRASQKQRRDVGFPSLQDLGSSTAIQGLG